MRGRQARVFVVFIFLYFLLFRAMHADDMRGISNPSASVQRGRFQLSRSTALPIFRWDMSVRTKAADAVIR